MLVDIKKENHEKIFSLFTRCYQHYSDSIGEVLIKNTKSLLSLVKLREQSLDEFNGCGNKKETRTGIVTVFFFGSNQIELAIYKYSIDSNMLMGYSKRYISNSELNRNEILYTLFLIEIGIANIKKAIPVEIESEFESILASSEATFFESENAKQDTIIRFKNYDVSKIKSNDNLKLALERIRYYLMSLDDAYPFNKYPANVCQSLIDKKINLDELQLEYPHSFYLLKACDYLIEYLHLKFLRSTKPEDLQLRKDSLENCLNNIDSLFDSQLISDDEETFWKAYGKNVSDEIYLFAKLKSKIVDDCDAFKENYDKSILNTDINLRIKNTLYLLKERCGGSKEIIQDQINLKNDNKYKALLTLDTITTIRLKYLKLAKDNHVDLFLLRQDLKKVEVPTENDLKKYLFNSVNKFVTDNANEFGINYSVEEKDKKIEVKFSITKKSKKYFSHLSGFPLGAATFNGLNNYYEFVLQTINDFQKLLNVKVEHISIIGGSDATPFSTSSQVSIEQTMNDDEFRVTVPNKGMVKLSKLDLKKNSDDKNIALGFKRGFYLKKYLIQKGLDSQKFNPIQVEFYKNYIDNSFRKCDIQMKFPIKG